MVISNIEDGFLEGEASTDQRVNFDHPDLYTGSEEEDESPDSTGGGVLYTRGLVDLGDEIGHSSEDLEEEAGLSLAVQHSIDASQRSLVEEKQLQKALLLSKEMSQCDGPVDQLNEAIRASLDEASNTVQLHVFGTDASNLLQVEVAFKKRVSQGQLVEQLDHHAAGDMTEYGRKCLEAIERKHGVAIQIDGTKISISGFRKFVSQALCDMTLVVNTMSHSPSDQEILRDVQWVFHNPLFSTTSPYSPDVIVFLENAWRMKMAKVDILLDHQRHIINLRDMQEYNTASGESVIISRETIGSEAMDREGPGKEFLQRVRIFLQTSYQKLVAMTFRTHGPVGSDQKDVALPYTCFSKASDQLIEAESFQERKAPCSQTCPMPPKLRRARTNFSR